MNELKDWCVKMAAFEGDSEVGVGFDLTREIADGVVCAKKAVARIAELERERDERRKLAGNEFHDEHELRKSALQEKARADELEARLATAEAAAECKTPEMRKLISEARVEDLGAQLAVAVEALERAEARCTKGFTGTIRKGGADEEQDITVCTICQFAETDMDGHADDCPFKALASLPESAKAYRGVVEALELIRDYPVPVEKWQQALKQLHQLKTIANQALAALEETP